MSIRKLRITAGLLVGAHVLAGATMGAAALQFDDWADWQSVAYAGLIGGEMLLLGIWTGFSGSPWLPKLAGLFAGVAWLSALTVLPDPDDAPYWAACSVVAIPVLVVAVGCGFWRFFIARIEWRSHWAPKSVAEDMRFSLKTLVILTIAISLLLALGRLIRWLHAGDPHFGFFILIVVLQSLLAVISTLWSCLGNGQTVVRVPLMLMTMAGVGVLLPYYTGLEWNYFFLWLALMLVIAVYSGGSLLVVRSCGYRLVRLVRTPADSTSGANGTRTSPETEVAK